MPGPCSQPSAHDGHRVVSGKTRLRRAALRSGMGMTSGLYAQCKPVEKREPRFDRTTTDETPTD